MQFAILGPDFAPLKIFDSFESLIWTERYSACGDFELYTPMSDEMLHYLTDDNYLYLNESEYDMIIEDFEIASDADDEDKYKVTGRTLESILERRIIWNQTNIDGSLQDGVQKLLNENLIAPTIADRKIDNFIFEASTDTNITSLTLNAQYWGENLYDTIKGICNEANIGFKVIRNSSNQFVFSLYLGTNRSYDQQNTPWVIFSKDFGNLASTNYIYSKKTLKNITLVTGEGEGTAKKSSIVSVSETDVTGMNRREIYTDGSSISATTNDGILTDTQYLAKLEKKGEETLKDNLETKTFEGEAHEINNYIYGSDYFIGDLVGVLNEYGIKAACRITEFIRTVDDEGTKMYPTFDNAEGGAQE